MKRDMELIRKILFEIEKIEEQSFTNADLPIPGYDMNVIGYHCKLLADENLIFDYNYLDADDGLCAFSASGLTWEGHDFLDKIREDTIWNKIKKTLADKGMPILIETVKSAFTIIITEVFNKY